tara:strand:- start:260 stop:412 length:153 start_codon:yes stop_codon:yes gene_type:complete
MRKKLIGGVLLLVFMGCSALHYIPTSDSDVAEKIKQKKKERNKKPPTERK